MNPVLIQEQLQFYCEPEHPQKYASLRPTLTGTKNLYGNEPNPFKKKKKKSYGNENGPERFVTRLQTTNGFGAQIRLHQRYKTANGFRTQRNYYNIWPIVLLELKYIITSARNAAAIAKGMVELRSIVFYSREKRARWRQGPRCLEMLEVKDGRWFGGLDDDSPKVKWMRRVYPRVDYTPAPWTVAGTVDRCYA